MSRSVGNSERQEYKEASHALVSGAPRPEHHHHEATSGINALSGAPTWSMESLIHLNSGSRERGLTVCYLSAHLYIYTLVCEKKFDTREPAVQAVVCVRPSRLD